MALCMHTYFVIACWAYIYTMGTRRSHVSAAPLPLMMMMLVLVMVLMMMRAV